MWKEYLFPNDITEALTILSDSGGLARIIAGGTDLILDLERGRHQVERLVDLSKIRELSDITEVDGMLSIGANVTCSQVANSRLVWEKAPALADGAHKLGSKQIRNVATLAGNVVRAQPAADTAIPLVALDARAEVVSQGGVRTIDVLDAYGDGFAKSTVDSSSEILTRFLVPSRKAGEGSAYVRHDKRNTLSLPILNIACSLGLTDNVIQKAMIAMGPVGPGPRRAVDAEKRLIGSTPDSENITAAAELVINQCDPRDSLVRGSRKYRLAVVSVLAKRVIGEALASASK